MVDISKAGCSSGIYVKTVSSNAMLRSLTNTNKYTITITPSALVLVSDVTQIVKTSELGNGRVVIKARSNGLLLRTYARRTSSLSTDIFDASKSERAIDDGNWRTTALFKYDTRYIKLDMKNSANYLICGHPKNDGYLNDNEYPKSIDDRLAGKDGIGKGDWIYMLNGNYDTIYWFQLHNPNNHTLTLTPTLENELVCLIDDGSGWKIMKSPISIDTTNKKNIRFILVGGNYGRVLISTY